MAVKKSIQDKVAWLQTLFAPIMNTPITITFGSHTFTDVVIVAVEHKPVTGFKLAPEKRTSLDGKQYTPNLLRIAFAGGEEMIFVDESTTWAAISK
jgi:hypothetical protein